MTTDICLSDELPCSRSVRGVGDCGCVTQRVLGKIVICPRFYGQCVLMFLQSVFGENHGFDIVFETVGDSYFSRRGEAKRHEHG